MPRCRASRPGRAAPSRNEVSSISRTPARRRATSTRRIASSGRKDAPGAPPTRTPKRMNVRPAADAASAIRITRPPLRRDGDMTSAVAARARQARRPGTPKISSRPRRTSESASEASGGTPRRAPMTMYPPSCTPGRPARRRPLSGSLSPRLCHMIAAGTLTGCPGSTVRPKSRPFPPAAATCHVLAATSPLRFR